MAYNIMLTTTLVLIAALTVQTYRLRSKLQRRDFVHVGIAIAITAICVVAVNSHKPVERVTKQRSITTTTQVV